MTAERMLWTRVLVFLAGMAVAAPGFAQEATECKTVPVRVTHDEFPKDAFECVEVGPVGIAKKIHRLVAISSTAKYLFIQHWEALFPMRYTYLAGRPVLNQLIESIWDDEIVSWTERESLLDGQYVGFLTKGEEVNFPCFGFRSYRKPGFSGTYKRIMLIVYCEVGDEFLSKNTVSEVVESVSW